MIHIIFEIIRVLLSLITVVLVVYVVISWLYAFDVVSRRNAFVNSIWEFTKRLSDPILTPFRRLIPPIAGVDLSTLIVILILQLLNNPGDPFHRDVLGWLESLLRGGPVF